MLKNSPIIKGRVLNKSDIGKILYYNPDYDKCSKNYSKYQECILHSFTYDKSNGWSIFVKFNNGFVEEIDPKYLSWNNFLDIKKNLRMIRELYESTSESFLVVRSILKECNWNLEEAKKLIGNHND